MRLASESLCIDGMDRRQIHRHGRCGGSISKEDVGSGRIDVSILESVQDLNSVTGSPCGRLLLFFLFSSLAIPPALS